MGLQHSWLLIGVSATAIAACTATTTEEPNLDDYIGELSQICVDTEDVLDALPDPPTEIPISDFAIAAAMALQNEAESVRELAPPTDLADDHRAFVRNTDAQSASWRAISAVPDSDPAAFESLVTTIGEQTLGRNDLAVEMGVPACVRAPE